MKGEIYMKVTIEMRNEEIRMLKELSTVSGLGVSAIVSSLLHEVYSSYRCSKISKSIDYMPATLLTDKLLKDIKS